MKYALGLSMIGAGALLVYAGIKDRSAWDTIVHAINPNAPVSQSVSANRNVGPPVNSSGPGSAGSW